MIKVEPYEEVHLQGFLSVEKELPIGTSYADLGVQISEDGRVWICINGEAVIRFKSTQAFEANDG